MAEENINLLERVTDIVMSYLENNRISAAELPGLISSVHDGLVALTTPSKPELNPAVDIKRSIRPDHIVCLEDGKRYKSLRRHLMTHHDMTPEEYRAKWGLPKDYPMVAPDYAERRSELARASGLGRKPAARRGRKKR